MSNTQNSDELLAAVAGSPVDAACYVAEIVRVYVRRRQHHLRCQCDEIHANNPIQAAAWLMVINDLDAVADFCIELTLRASKANVQPSQREEKTK